LVFSQPSLQGFFFLRSDTQRFSAALLPLGIGIVIAYILLPLVEALDRLKIPRTISIVISFVLSLIIIMVILLWLVPIFVDNIKDLTTVLPEIFEETFLNLKGFIERNIPIGWRRNY
jgi:predicted PurR-regulated permease PerM